MYIINWAVNAVSNCFICMRSLAFTLLYFRLSETLADFAERIIVLKLIYRRILNRYNYGHLMSGQNSCASPFGIGKGVWRLKWRKFALDCGMIVHAFLYPNTSALILEWLIILRNWAYLVKFDIIQCIVE